MATTPIKYLRATNDEAPAGLQVVDGVIVQIDAGDHGLDHLLLESVSHLLQANVLVMLHRDDDGVHAHRQHGAVVLAVLDCHLKRKRGEKKLALRPEQIEQICFTDPTSGTLCCCSTQNNNNYKNK